MNICGRKPKLTPAQVRRVREWAEFGRSPSQVAAKLGVSRKTISAYIRGEHKRRYE